MKKIASAILLLVAVISFSCSSDSDSSSNDDTFIKFKANGVQYNMHPVATASSLIGSMGSFSGSGTSYRTVTLNMPIVPTVGVHPITAPSFETDAYEATFGLSDDFDDVDATSGTMTITSVNGTYVEGTFSFTGTYNGETYNITEGSFKGYTPEDVN